MAETETTFIPNSFQTPNEIVDRAMQHLTDAELRVLLFVVRHTLGWKSRIKSRAGHISLSMFERGFTVAKEDGTTDIYGGCGLKEHAIRKAADSLVALGLLVKVGDPTPKGQLWQLGDTPDWNAIEARTRDRDTANQKRTVKGRAIAKAKRQGGVVAQKGFCVTEGVMSHSTPLSDNGGLSHSTGGVLSHNRGEVLSDNTPPPLSDRTQLNPYINSLSKPWINPAADAHAPTHVHAHTGARDQTAAAAQTPQQPDLTLEADRHPIMGWYERTFSNLLTPRMVDYLLDLAKEHPADVLEAAFDEAKANNAYAIQYVEKILARRKADAADASRAKAPPPTNPDLPPIPRRILDPAIAAQFDIRKVGRPRPDGLPRRDTTAKTGGAS